MSLLEGPVSVNNGVAALAPLQATASRWSDILLSFSKYTQTSHIAHPTASQQSLPIDNDGQATSIWWSHGPTTPDGSRIGAVLAAMTRGPLPDPSKPSLLELWHEAALKPLAQSSDGQSAAGAPAMYRLQATQAN